MRVFSYRLPASRSFLKTNPACLACASRARRSRATLHRRYRYAYCYERFEVCPEIACEALAESEAARKGCRAESEAPRNEGSSKDDRRDDGSERHDPAKGSLRRNRDYPESSAARA